MIVLSTDNGSTYGVWFCFSISMASLMDDGWCDNKKGVGETDGVWWKGKGEL